MEFIVVLELYDKIYENPLFFGILILSVFVAQKSNLSIIFLFELKLQPFEICKSRIFGEFQDFR